MSECNFLKKNGVSECHEIRSENKECRSLMGQNKVRMSLVKKVENVTHMYVEKAGCRSVTIFYPCRPTRLLCCSFTGGGQQILSIVLAYLWAVNKSYSIPYVMWQCEGRAVSWLLCGTLDCET